MRGYGITGGELYINWTDFADQLQRLQADAVAMPEGVTVTVEDFYWDDDRKTPLPSTRTLAIDADGETLGICETIASNEYPLRPSINVSSRPPDSVSIYSMTHLLAGAGTTTTRSWRTPASCRGSAYLRCGRT